MYEKVDIRTVLGDMSFAIYPKEVEPDLDIYTLIMMAAAYAKAAPALGNVFQFVFIVKGGVQSRLLQIGAEKSSVSEIKAGAEVWREVLKSQVTKVN